MLEVKDLHVKFHSRDREAVGGVSFTIQDGEILGLVGESGSGKSVTAMSIAGLLPRKQCDYSGEILLDGTDLLHADRALLRKVQGRDVGVVFQEPMSSMDPLMKVGRQVEEVLRLHSDTPPQERRRMALEVLAAVELPDPEEVYGKYPHELSGGMLQRAMIAAAVVSRPRLLLLDEPTTALDVTIQDQILKQLRALQRESGASIIFITHDLGVVAEIADRVVILYSGRKVEEGSIEAIFSKPLHPYTVGLMKAVPNVDEDDFDIQPIPGTFPNITEEIGGCRFHPRCPYATDRCRAEVPAEIEVEPGHLVSCHKVAEEYPGKEVRK